MTTSTKVAQETENAVGLCKSVEQNTDWGQKFKSGEVGCLQRFSA